MENLKKFEPLNELIHENGGGLSKSLMVIHNLVIYDCSLPDLPLSAQNDLFCLHEVAQAIKQIEIDMFPLENEKIKELQSLLEESEKEKIKLKKLLKEANELCNTKDRVIEATERNLQSIEKFHGYLNNDLSNLEVVKKKTPTNHFPIAK